MKKITAILMAAIMLMSLCAQAFALEENQSEVTLTIDPSETSDYEITIPTDVDIEKDPETGKYEGEEEIILDVAEIFSDPGMEGVRVTLGSAENDNGGKHYLAPHPDHPEYAENKSLVYSIQKDAADVVLGLYSDPNATTILEVEAGGEEARAVLDLGLVSVPSQAGIFRDVLTFSIGMVAGN